MHIHILGIAGKLMSGIALMAKHKGYTVTGSDANLNSPMATQLKAENIKMYEGYSPEHIDDNPDLVIVGNVMSRGNPLIEALLNKKIPFVSAPEWLARYVFHDKWVLAVSGTHGKTTTTSMVAWILEFAGLNPGFLVGGNPNNFSVSSRLTDSKFFVIEADEYDSAFFDKRPKFVHYHPKTLIINNLEFDHADIYDDLEAIQKQFHYLVRTVPSEGLIITPKNDANVDNVLQRGLWTPNESVGDNGDWEYELLSNDASHFNVIFKGNIVGEVNWSMIGEHNLMNALTAIAAAHHAGVSIEKAANALCEFKGVERRMQPLGELNGAKVFDDFAHHPTAVKTTLHGLRNNLGHNARIVVILEFGSYTMKAGSNSAMFPDSLTEANQVYLLSRNCNWDVSGLANKITVPNEVHSDLDTMAQSLNKNLNTGDFVVIMTNQDSVAISKAIGL